MNKVLVLSGVACVSVFLATGAFAEILGVQPGTSSNPKDNVPNEIQRSTNGQEPFSRSDELVGMKKEKPEPVTQQKLEKNVEKTQGGGAAIAAEGLQDKSMEKSEKGISTQSSQKGMKEEVQTGSGAQASPSDAVKDGLKKDPKATQGQYPETNMEGQRPFNALPMEKK